MTLVCTYCSHHVNVPELHQSVCHEDGTLSNNLECTKVIGHNFGRFTPWWPTQVGTINSSDMVGIHLRGYKKITIHYLFPEIITQLGGKLGSPFMEEEEQG